MSHEPSLSRRSAMQQGAALGASAALAFAPSGPASAASTLTPERARATVQAVLNSLVADAERPITGASVAWLHESGRQGRAWAGWRSIGAAHPQGSLPIDGQTLFRVASISKLAQALACLRLHEAGLLRLDEDLGGVWRRSFRHPLHRAIPLTARLLLSHRSGLLDRVTLPLPSGEALRRTLADPSNWGPEEPGRMFRYSNLGSAVLATVMEAATGEPYDHLMQHWLFEPLGIHPAFALAGLPPSRRQQVATLYRRPEGSGQWVPQADSRGEPPHPAATPAALVAVGDNASVHSPAGGLRASLPDLVRLAQLLIGQGQFDAQRLYSSASHRLLTEAQWTHSALTPGDTAGGLFRSWALGLQRFIDVQDAQGGDRLHPRGGITGLGHLGLAYGLLSGLIVLPGRGPAEGSALIYVINGTSQAASDTPGRHSSLRRCEERIVETLLEVLDKT